MKLLTLILSFFITFFNNPNEDQSIKFGGNLFFKVDKSLFFATAEITTSQYNEFLLTHKNLPNLVVNNEGWTKGDTFNKSYFIPEGLYYQIQKKHAQHPVVNIRQEAAVEYCRHLSYEYNRDPIREFKEVKFRLPTKKEWLEVFNKYLPKSIEDERLGYIPLKPDSITTANNWNNHKVTEETFNGSDYLEYLQSDDYVSVFTTWPVTYYQVKRQPQIYHMVGNVSEWVQEEQTSMGGNWITKSKEEIDRELINKSFSPMIGFRVVMEIVKE